MIVALFDHGIGCKYAPLSKVINNRKQRKYY